jgi:hypothetical protein
MKFDPRVENWRIKTGPYASEMHKTYGCFYIPGPCATELVALADDGRDQMILAELRGWEHVSVSTRKMCFVKDLFWDAEECVVQFHPPRSQWISNHPHCLHLWRAIDIVFPLPPSLTVGIREAGEIASVQQAEQIREQLMLRLGRHS